MQFMLMIYGDEATGPTPDSPEFGPYMQGYVDFTEKVEKEGKLQSGEALQPVATAKTISIRGEKPVITDGPYVETKEQLGGYYLLDCANMDEALEYAAMIPDAKSGYVEIRPVMVFE